MSSRPVRGGTQTMRDADGVRHAAEPVADPTLDDAVRNDLVGGGSTYDGSDDGDSSRLRSARGDAKADPGTRKK